MSASSRRARAYSRRRSAIDMAQPRLDCGERASGATLKCIPRCRVLMPALLRPLAALAVALSFSVLSGALAAQSVASAGQRRSLLVDGVERSYFVYLPESH